MVLPLPTLLPLPPFTVALDSERAPQRTRLADGRADAGLKKLRSARQLIPGPAKAPGFKVSVFLSCANYSEKELTRQITLRSSTQLGNEVRGLEKGMGPIKERKESSEIQMPEVWHQK